jgi:hypothetical protein
MKKSETKKNRRKLKDRNPEGRYFEGSGNPESGYF